MSLQELLIDLQKRMDIAKQAKEYQAIVERAQNQSLFTEYTTKESYLTGDVADLNAFVPTVSKPYLNLTGDTSEANEMADFRSNLGKLFTPIDVEKIISYEPSFDIDAIRMLNQFWSSFSQSVSTVRFRSIEDVVATMTNFSDKLLNRVSLNRATVKSSKKKKKIRLIEEAEPVIGEPVLEPSLTDVGEVASSEPVSAQPVELVDKASNLKLKLLKDLDILLQDVRNQDFNITNDILRQQIVDDATTIMDKRDFSTTRSQTKKFYDLLTKIRDENEIDELSLKTTKVFRANNASNYLLPVPSTAKPEVFEALFKLYVSMLLDTLGTTRSTFTGKGLKPRPKKAVKMGMGIKTIKEKVPIKRKVIEKMVFGHLYVDITKLKNNNLFVKYVNTYATKFSISITEPTKIVILELLLGKFNLKSYEKLSDEERKIVAYLNDMLNIIPADQMPSPIEDMVEKFHILRGQLLASNDNPQIKSELKKLLFELHKLNKINSATLRNVIYEITSIE